MTDLDDDVELARDVLSETLHGPVPMATVVRLADAVIRLDAERQWRPLTEDPASWPEVEGRALFILVTGYVAIGEHVDMPTGAVILDGEDDATYHLGDSLVAWLPLPEPPKGESR